MRRSIFSKCKIENGKWKRWFHFSAGSTSMDEKFNARIAGLPFRIRDLQECPVRFRTNLKGVPDRGVYLFIEEDKPLYVGRTNRMKDRFFSAQRTRVATMGIKYLRVDDPIDQHLFEVYVAEVLQTPYNDFDNH